MPGTSIATQKDASPKRDYSSLKGLGLSKTAICCYQSLADDGSAKVSVLAKRLELPRTGLYRVLEVLSEQGFVHKIKLDGVSTTYTARPLHKAVESFFKYQMRLVRPLLGGYEEFVKEVQKKR